MVALTIAAFFVIRTFGERLRAPTPAVAPGSAEAPVQAGNVLVHVLIALVAVIAVGQLLARLFAIVHQPPVIGEVIAGILLGPSLIGARASAWILPPKVAPFLGIISQLGVILYMFIVGLELNAGLIKGRAKAAVATSHASILVPFLLGSLLALVLYPRLSTSDVPFTNFALFVGVAMSITAFPVLARILTDLSLTRTELGVVAISCAATDDVTAWCLLAVVIAIAKAGALTTAIFTILLALLFVLLMFYVMKPLLAKVASSRMRQENPGQTVVALSFFVLLSSAFAAEIIGIHALFGSFIAGLILPEISSFKNRIREKIEDVSLMILLPIFFAFTGLRTQIGLLNEGSSWAICGIIIAVAVVGKFAGSMFAAKAVGQTWADSLRIGALMNTRGLMELIVLNIGYDLGILSPEIFAMMVLMALATTLMTGPSLDLIDWVSKIQIVSRRKKIREGRGEF